MHYSEESAQNFKDETTVHQSTVNGRRWLYASRQTSKGADINVENKKKFGHVTNIVHNANSHHYKLKYKIGIRSMISDTLWRMKTRLLFIPDTNSAFQKDFGK